MITLIVAIIASVALALFLYINRACYLPIRSKKEMLSDFENEKHKTVCHDDTDCSGKDMDNKNKNDSNTNKK